MKKTMLIFFISLMFLLTGCDLIDEIICDHNFEVTEKIESTCTEKGYIYKKCSKCDLEKAEILELLPHDFDEWNILLNPTEFEDGLKNRHCLRCGLVEEKIIYSDSYIDLDIIRFDYQKNFKYNINNYEELELLFNASLLNLSSTMICNINYEIDNFNELIQKLVNESRIPLTFEISASKKGKTLEIVFTYPNIASKTTSLFAYKQYSSINHNNYISSREVDYNDFKINNSKYTYEVSTSEQLFYVLQRKVKPICEEGSVAQLIYNEMKKVLIEVIDDKMTDFEKAKAIHDWLILNVTYDEELLQLVSNGQDVIEYNGFYLEGVFLDKKAVCEGIAKAFCCMANIEGIPCVFIEGYQSDNQMGLGHAWNKIYIDDTWYIVDTTSDGTIINSEYEILSYQKFLIDDKTMSKKYISKYYNDLICNENYDYYKNFTYTYENNNYDFIIDSQKELTQIIKYYFSLNQSYSTIEFKVTFNFGESISDEINKAYNELNITGQFSYIANENIIVLVN